eukprot:1258118-Amorphochlora_amoeboformis.AAC.1
MTLVNKNRTLVKRIEAEGADKTDKTNPKSTRALADSNVLDMRAREVRRNSKSCPNPNAS